MTTYEDLARLRELCNEAAKTLRLAEAALDEALATVPPERASVGLARRRVAAAERAVAQAEQQMSAALADTIGALDVDVPLLLLPVRLETRYVPASTQLKIRVYPDDIHIDAHEPELTATEAAAGQDYWRAVRAASPLDKVAERLRAWSVLVATVGPERAAWTAQVLEPTNPATEPEPKFPATLERAGRWTRAARAELLPDCWRAEAWRGGGRVATATGRLIRRPLASGPDPKAEGTVDEGMRWMSEFDEALQAGMALEIQLPDRDPLDLLLVFGVRGSQTPAEDAAEIDGLLAAQRYGVGAGLDLLAAGTPTNNSEAAPSSHGAPDPTGSGRFVDPIAPPAPPAKDDAGDADRLASALGLSIDTFAGLPGATNGGVSIEADMATLLWPATWGYYLTQMLRLPEWGDQGRPEWRRWALDRVRACGPLPALRAGRQPYGILPVTSLDRWRPPSGNGIVSVELLRPTRRTFPTSTQIRYLGNLNQSGIWTILGPNPLSFPGPDDATAIAATSADIADDGTSLLLVAHATGPDLATGGIRITAAKLEEGAAVVVGRFSPEASGRGFPSQPLRGLAMAAGRLDAGAAPGSAPDLVLILQFEAADRRRTAQTLIVVGGGISTRGASVWHNPVDVSDEFTVRERITSAALVPGEHGGCDLITVSEIEGTGASPRARLRIARNLERDGQGATWSAPEEVGTHTGDSASAGTAITFGDVDGDGVPEALLAQYSPLDDDTVAALYMVGKAAGGGSFTWAATGNLGSGTFVPADHELAGAGFTFHPRLPIHDLSCGLATAGQQVNLLRRLRDDWRDAAQRVSRVQPRAPSTSRALLDILAGDATSSVCDRRPFIGGLALGATWKLIGEATGPVSAGSEVEALLLGLGLGFDAEKPPRLARGAYTSLSMPIASEPPGTDTAGLPFIGNGRDAPLSWLLQMRKASPQELHDHWLGPEVPLLARLVRHSLLQAYADAAFALVPIAFASPPPLPEPELVDLPDFTSPDPAEGVTTLTSWRHLSDPATQFGGEQVASFLWSAGLAGALPKEAEPLGETLAALGRLVSVPAGELVRTAGGVLDLASHRLDAWITAVATSRLAELRAATPAGLHAGGYGYVRDLAPASGPASTGYIHAPSMTHATTAAVLRSGFLSHDQAQLAVDLSSRRVRAAVDVLSALGEGQSLGAALGYRFERSLTDLRLAQYLGPFRQIAPLEVAQLRPIPKGTDVATLGMVTTDGLALLELADQDKIDWGSVPDGQTQGLPAVSDPHQARLLEAIQLLRDVADAIADIGTAESVHQILQRNPIRAAGTLDALTRGELPASADPDVLRTPRQGVGVTHRIVVIAPDPAEATATAALALWKANTDQRARHVRAAAEPRLNAWAALVLGDPARVRFRVTSRNPATGGPLLDPDTGQPADDPATITLEKAGLSPWDILAGPSPDVASLAETNLGRRLLRFAATTPEAPGTDLALLADRGPDWSPEDLSLPELLTVAETARAMVMAARPANANDLRAAGGDADIDTAELQRRLKDARDALAAALSKLRGFFTVSDSGRTALLTLYPGLKATTRVDNLLDLPSYFDIGPAARLLKLPAENRIGTCGDALEIMSAFGIADAAPRPRSADLDTDRVALAVQSRAAHVKGLERTAAADAQAAGDPKAALEALFGDGFRALPLFAHGHGATPVAVGATRDAVDRWFDGVAMVRDGVSRLQDVLVASEIAGGGAGSWDVVQVPTTNGERWVGLQADPAGAARIPAGRVSVVASCMVPDWRKNEKAAALWIDAWVETVPAVEENTAVAFHLDTPDACAPQAMLLAVAPDRSVPWSWDVLGDVLRETIGLSEIRLIDAHLMPAYGHLLPAMFLAHSNGGVPGGDTIATGYGV